MSHPSSEIAMILPYNSFRLATAQGFDADLPQGDFDHAENAVNTLHIHFARLEHQRGFYVQQ